MPSERHSPNAGAGIDQLVNPPIAAQIVETVAILHPLTLPQPPRNHPDLRPAVSLAGRLNLRQAAICQAAAVTTTEHEV